MFAPEGTIESAGSNGGCSPGGVVCSGAMAGTEAEPALLMTSGAPGALLPGKALLAVPGAPDVKPLLDGVIGFNAVCGAGSEGI